MNTNNPEFELMRQEIYRIGGKIDALPQIYITRNEHDPWRTSVEKRFDEIGRQFDEIDKLKTEGTRWTLEERTRIHNQIQETERHLQEKMDKNIDQLNDIHTKLAEKIDTKLENSAQTNWSWRQAWLIFAGTSIISIAGYVVNYLMSHH